MCKSDVEIVTLVGGHTGCQFLNYNIGAVDRIRLTKAVKGVGVSRKVSHSRMNRAAGGLPGSNRRTLVISRTYSYSGVAVT